MNRKQAENVLDAYVENARSRSVNGRKAAESLREVILNAMTDTRYYPITINPTDFGWTKVEPYKPTVTWTGEADVSRPLNATEVS